MFRFRQGGWGTLSQRAERGTRVKKAGPWAGAESAAATAAADFAVNEAI